MLLLNDDIVASNACTGCSKPFIEANLKRVGNGLYCPGCYMNLIKAATRAENLKEVNSERSNDG